MYISNEIIQLIDKKKIKKPRFIFLCIGTDRIIGDSLGPIVGSNIEKYIQKNNIKNVKVIGNLEKNLNNTNIKKYKKEKDDITIVIDSAISHSYDIGNIVIDEKIMEARKAICNSKKIDSDINIKCIVAKNFDNEEVNFLMLQNVKLGIVLNLAEKLSNNIYQVINKYK